MDREYIFFLGAAVIGWIVIIPTIYFFYRGGLALRLSIILLSCVTVPTLLAFWQGKEGASAARVGIAFVIAVPFIAILFIVVLRQIVYPIKQMARVAQGVAEGDLEQTITVKNKDEIGDMARASTQMIVYLQEMAEAANRLAQGDVTADITPKSDRDVLGNAFGEMITYQQMMAQAADQMAQGDLAIDVVPKNEKDALGLAFNQMISNLRNLIGQVQESASQVANASMQLNTAADHTGQASQQVTTTIQQVADGANQQTGAVTETTVNVEEIARAANGIARGAQEQAVGVQKTSDLIDQMDKIVDQVGQVSETAAGANGKVTHAARDGVVSVEQTSQGMQTIRSRTTDATEKVKEMEIRSNEISRIVETIDVIADKTDMLALNAAVEAARAGEHGRGFAVVADQVRKLSEDSKEATRDIDDLIARVQATVNEAIGAMQITTTEVDNGIQLAANTTQSLQEILQAAEEAVVMSGQIGAAVAQLKENSRDVVNTVDSVSAVVEENTAAAEAMAGASQEVTNSMEGVVSVAEENSASVEEVSASAEEMSAQIEEVVASAEELSALAEELRSATVRFRVDRGQDRTQIDDNFEPYAEAAPVLVGEDHGGNGIL